MHRKWEVELVCMTFSLLGYLARLVDIPVDYSDAQALVDLMNSKRSGPVFQLTLHYHLKLGYFFINFPVAASASMGPLPTEAGLFGGYLWRAYDVHTLMSKIK